MAFTYLKLTTFGQNLDAKCKLGKGLHLSRVAIGDGLLGSGSMVNRTALVSEKFSMLIDAKQLTEEGAVAAIISTLDNSSFTEGFPYRELGVMGVDPDTSQEGLYLYDNAGEECEYLDTQANGVTIYERLKLLIKTEDIDSITFDASGNPLYITFDEKGAADGVASLDANGKVPSEQLPTMSFEAPIKDQAAKATPVDADQVPIIDSADSSKTKLVLWSAIKSLFAAATHSHTAGDITSGTLGVSRGGTGVTTAAAERNRLGLGNTTDVLPVANGGTGAATADSARTNLSAALKPSIVTVTFATASWTLNATSNCYEQTVACAGLLAVDSYNIDVSPVGSTDAAAQALTDAAYAVMAGPGGRMSCDTDGYLYARCPAGAAAPTVAFQVAVVISR